MIAARNFRSAARECDGQHHPASLGQVRREPEDHLALERALAHQRPRRPAPGSAGRRGSAWTSGSRCRPRSPRPRTGRPHRPRSAASRASPAPVMPPPMIARSKRSASRPSIARARPVADMSEGPATVAILAYNRRPHAPTQAAQTGTLRPGAPRRPRQAALQRGARAGARGGRRHPRDRAARGRPRDRVAARSPTRAARSGSRSCGPTPSGRRSRSCSTGRSPRAAPPCGCATPGRCAPTCAGSIWPVPASAATPPPSSRPPTRAASSPASTSPTRRRASGCGSRRPRKNRAVSNGAIVRTERRGARVTYHFAETPPLSTYLYALVVGELESSRPAQRGLDTGPCLVRAGQEEARRLRARVRGRSRCAGSRPTSACPTRTASST